MTAPITSTPNAPEFIPSKVVTFDDHPYIREVQFFGTPEPGTPRQFVKENYISGSRLSTFDICESKYYWQYVVGAKSPTTSRIILGTALHEFAHYALYPRYQAFKRDGHFNNAVSIDDATLLAARKAAHDTLDREVKGAADGIIFETRWDKGPLSTPETMHEDLDLMIEAFRTEALDRIFPIEIEAGVLIRWTDPEALPFFGFLDILAVDADGNFYILDFKTGVKSKDADDVAYDLKMIGYTSASRLALGYDIRSMRYANFLRHKDGAKFRLFDVPFEPKSIIRVANRCLTTSLQIKHELFKTRDSKQWCPKCPFFTQCAQKFGPIVAATVTEAAAPPTPAEVIPLPTNPEPITTQQEQPALLPFAS